MAKSQSAFRTISEVSATLDTPTHVLRFWESKFTQIKPVKRAGGRRYYRPEDIALLSGIKTLLHDQGMTIKGAQKLLREQGVKHVTTLGDSVLQDDAVVQGDTVSQDDTVAQDDAGPEPIADVTAIEAAQTPAEAPQATPISVAQTPPPPQAAEPVAKPRERPPFVATILDANQVTMHKNSSQIKPLLAQLEAIRDRIRDRL